MTWNHTTSKKNNKTPTGWSLKSSSRAWTGEPCVTSHLPLATVAFPPPTHMLGACLSHKLSRATCACEPGVKATSKMALADQSTACPTTITPSHASTAQLCLPTALSTFWKILPWVGLLSVGACPGSSQPLPENRVWGHWAHEASRSWNVNTARDFPGLLVPPVYWQIWVT